MKFLFFINNFFIYNYLILAKYDYNTLLSNVWLSGASYCNKDNYKTMKIGGLANDFEVKHILYDKFTDLHGFIGILPSQKSINIVIRGTFSAINWFDDFQIRLVSYLTFPECNCKVHHGFYNSALKVSNETIFIIKNLINFYPLYKIIFSGHSYGAITSQLLAMEAVKNNYKVHIYNYGQPRGGDENYSKFVNEKINELYRVVHNTDIVPHVPPNDILGYYHSCQELFEDEYGNIIECSNYYCEDPKCSNKYKLSETNINDHYIYLGHELSCNSSIINL
jgi:hypothetical protein